MKAQKLQEARDIEAGYVINGNKVTYCYRDENGEYIIIELDNGEKLEVVSNELV